MIRPRGESCPHCEGERISLWGRVMDVDACHLISDQDRIVIGSGFDCDLTVADPLIPHRAFRLLHIKRHAGVADQCDSYWQLEACPGARVYVNGDLTTRSRLHFDDHIAIGCHQFVFRRAPSNVRNRRTMINVHDLCARLMRGRTPPRAYLAGCPSFRDRLRDRRARKWGLALLLLLAAFLLLFPRHRTFNQVQPPMEVVMVGPVDSPPPQAVRSLDDVARKFVDKPVVDTDPAALQPLPVPEPEKIDAQPLVTKAPARDQPPTPAKQNSPSMDEAPKLATLTPPTTPRPRPRLQRAPEKLTRSAPRRRFTRTEAADPAMRAALTKFDVGKLDEKTIDGALPTFTSPVTHRADQPSEADLKTDPNQRKAMLAAYQPSPLEYDTHRGSRIPVARMSQTLDKLAAGSGKTGIALDGKVTDREIAASWKSGQFRLHGPDPPKAEPPTYCYVSKTTKNGEEFLYVSFVCKDPDVSRIRDGHHEGPYRDDSVEVYLDTDFNRRDYYHLIVNTRGKYLARYCSNGEIGIADRGTPWSVSPQIKTSIDSAAGQWSCEILIPFSSLDGVPKEGSRWAVNFTRNYRGQIFPDSVNQNWFLVHKIGQNYHHPDLFGVFQW